MRPPGACVVFTAVFSLAVAAPLCAQEEWEGKTVNNVTGSGFVHEPKQKNLDLTGLKPKQGQIMTRERKDLAIKELFKTGKFQDVQIVPRIDAADKNLVNVEVAVVEYIIVEKVEFKGINDIPIPVLKPNLRLSAGEPLNPFHLK